VRLTDSLERQDTILILNPYQVIQMGHHHGHPLSGAMELRPRDFEELRTDTDQT